MSHIYGQLNKKLLFNRNTESLLYVKLIIMHALINFLVYWKGHSNEIQRSYITIVYFPEEKLILCYYTKYASLIFYRWFL